MTIGDEKLKRATDQILNHMRRANELKKSKKYQPPPLYTRRSAKLLKSALEKASEADCPGCGVKYSIRFRAEGLARSDDQPGLKLLLKNCKRA